MNGPRPRASSSSDTADNAPQSAPLLSERGQDSGSSLNRMLRVLDLFTIDQPILTLETVTSQLGYTLSSSYRYVRELCAAGLLASIGGGKYALGPRIIELDLQSRLTDPVSLSGREFVAPLLDCIPIGVVMICELRGNRVVSVVAEKKPETLSLQRERGHTMGLFLGSAAKAILVHLPNRRLSRIYSEFSGEIAAAGMGDDRRSFIKNVSKLRRQRYILSKGELNPKNFGLSAPVFYGAGQIAGSLNVLVPLTHYSDELVEQLIEPLLEAAAKMNSRLADFATSQPGSRTRQS